MQDEILECTVLAGSAGQRVDKFLASVCDDLSRARLQSLISEGQVTRNGDVLRTLSFKVEEGDDLCVHVPPPQPCEPEAENIPLDVVYEDDDLLVINKAAGMVVHPGAGNWTGTLVNALLHHCGDSLSGIGGVVRPGIVHRLDKETTGLMLVAKNDHAHHYLSEQLADRTLSRVYHALVFGVPLPIKGVIDRPIGRHRNHRIKMSVMSNSPKEARTRYKVLKNYKEALSLVECSLDTGRTHQIRVHMEDFGHPLIGDALYGPQPTAVKGALKRNGYPIELYNEFCVLSRQMLHAKSISFRHPKDEEIVTFVSKLPEDMSKLLNLMNK